MGFLGGLIIGLYFGCVIGIFLMSLISANGNTDCDDCERAKYFNCAGKDRAKDRNEF